MNDRPVVFLSAGEASGDRHAGAVARELRARIPGVELVGLGGTTMADADVELLAGLEDLAVMGFVEVARRIGFFRDLRRRAIRTLEERGVRLLIPVDYPGFNLSLARAAHRRGIRVLWFIAPQVWAWRERRARTLAGVCDRVLTVLPFEDELLASHGVDSRFVGHPLLDERPVGRVTEEGPCLGLFPGSRAQEVERMLPPFAEAADRLREETPGLRTVVARAGHLPESYYAPWPGEVSTARDTMSRATAAIAASGTVTLELALAGIPMVVGYRTGAATFALARRIVRVPSIALPNLVAGRPVVPELLQEELTGPALADAARPFLDPASPDRRAAVDALAAVRADLGAPGCAARVAEEAAGLLD